MLQKLIHKARLCILTAMMSSTELFCSAAPASPSVQTVLGMHHRALVQVDHQFSWPLPRALTSLFWEGLFTAWALALPCMQLLHT